MEGDVPATNEDNRPSGNPGLSEEIGTEKPPSVGDRDKEVSESSIEKLRRQLPEYLCESAQFCVSPKVKETFQRFCFVHSKGRRLNDEIHKNRRISNPYFVANTLKQYNVDQGATGIRIGRRRKLMDTVDVDSIEALRKHRKQQRQMQQQSEAKKEGESKVTDSMAAIRQEAISQFVMDAKQRLQSMQKAKF